MWRPDSGVSPNRGFVMAGEGVWRHFHGRLREISREWEGAPQACIDAARDELRAEVRELVTRRGLTGPFLIPI